MLRNKSSQNRSRTTNSKKSNHFMTINENSALHKASLKLFQTKNCADVTFIIDSEEILAHKCYLIRSPVFEAMFLGPLAPKEHHPVIPLVDFDATASEFETFLQFFYTDYVNISSNNVHSVFKLAHMYDVPSLLKSCTSYILDCLKISNALETLSFAFLYRDESSLFETCMKFICSNAPEVVKQPDFIHLHEEILCEILKRDDLQICEEDIFDMIIQWTSEEIQRRELLPIEYNFQIVSQNVIEHIRFPLMDSLYLATQVKDSKLLTSSECSEILSRVIVLAHNETQEYGISRFSSKPRISIGTQKRKLIVSQHTSVYGSSKRPNVITLESSSDSDESDFFRDNSRRSVSMPLESYVLSSDDED